MSNMSKDQMYENLFHKVMDSKTNKQTHRIKKEDEHLVNTYRNGINEIQDKLDREYQRQLAQVNKMSVQRMMDHQANREIKKNANAIKVKNDQIQKEMEECTFSPRIYTNTKEAQIIKDRVGDRSTMSQQKIVEYGIEKKEQWISQQKIAKEEKTYR